MIDKKIKSFTDLHAWSEGRRLVQLVYNATKEFPKDEIFGLSDQMRRSSISIPSNIAEGFSRNSYKEKVQFYFISLGSTTELQNQIYISKDVDYISNELFNKILGQSIRVHKLVNGLIKSCKTTKIKQTWPNT